MIYQQPYSRGTASLLGMLYLASVHLNKLRPRDVDKSTAIPHDASFNVRVVVILMSECRIDKEPASLFLEMGPIYVKTMLR